MAFHAQYRLLVIALLALAANPTQAERQLDFRVPLHGATTVAIRLPVGNLKITGADARDVGIQGRLGSGYSELNTRLDRGVLVISAQLDGLRSQTAKTELSFSVPRTSALQVGTVSGDITLAGVAGALRISSVHGNVTVASNSAHLIIRVEAGDIDVQGSIGEADIRNGAGSIRLRGKVRRLQAQTAAGDIDVGMEAGQQIDLRSPSGKITLALPGPGQARGLLSTLNGTIEVRFADAPVIHFGVEELTGLKAGSPLYPRQRASAGERRDALARRMLVMENMQRIVPLGASATTPR